MKYYKYMKVNAFTSGESLGNPAAFIDLGKDTLESEEMLQIAKEHKGFVSEFIFITRVSNRIKLTYYSSECEVSFCGHGTIATMYELIQSNPELMNQDEFQIETNKKGILTVFNKIPSDDAIFITAPDAVFYESDIPKNEIANSLGIKESVINEQYPIDIIDAGLRTLIVPINDFENEIMIYPIKEVLEDFCITKQIDIVLIFSKKTSNSKCFAHTRVFAPKFGYLEDPATGSGNSAFGNYLIKNKLWNGEIIAIEQGGGKIVYNEVKLLNKNNKILFGGKATKKVEGIYYFK
jgi:PhzF family phenazine biosynthesis protein